MTPAKGQPSQDAYLKNKFRRAASEIGSIGAFDLSPYTDDPGLGKSDARTLTAIVDRLAWCTERLRTLAESQEARS